MTLHSFARRFRLAAALVPIALLAAPASAETPAPAQIASGAFDFYVFTLSWSPGFCDTSGDSRSPEQCSAGSGLGFVVHGLWPDNRYAADPADCGSMFVPSEALQATQGLYPNAGLARYEFEKHGTCTGYAPDVYFQAVKYLREQIITPSILAAPHMALRVSPDDIEQAFMKDNANLHADNIAVTCSRGELIDVRICVSKDMKAFAVCPPKVLGHSCRMPQLTVAPVR